MTVACWLSSWGWECHELVCHVCHEDDEGEIWSPNLFSKEGARWRLEVDQFPSRRCSIFLYSRCHWVWCGSRSRSSDLLFQREFLITRDDLLTKVRRRGLSSVYQPIKRTSILTHLCPRFHRPERPSNRQ